MEVQKQVPSKYSFGMGVKYGLSLGRKHKFEGV
jgi:hypothetical protein